MDAQNGQSAARSKARRISGLYAITPSQPASNSLEIMLEEAFHAGVRLLQYRRKAHSQQFDEASRWCQMAHAAGATFIVNDNPDLATAVNADGVHWGRDDVPLATLADRIRAIKAARGGHFVVGVSCYDDLARAKMAAAAGADYLAFGSVFASLTKPNAPCASLELIRAAKAVFNVPIVAIGGITRDNAAAVIDAGADALAVISDIFPTQALTAPDSIVARVKAYSPLFENKQGHVSPIQFQQQPRPF